MVRSNAIWLTPGGSLINGCTTPVSAPTNVAPPTTLTFIECARLVAPMVSCVIVTPPPLGPNPSGLTGGASNEYTVCAFAPASENANAANTTNIRNENLILPPSEDLRNGPPRISHGEHYYQ